MAPRKIIHIDMDCFYAAIEERDNPALRGKPVAVGGSTRRGVLTTANYEARKFGCHSAMPVFLALRKCPKLIVVPVRFDVYKEASRQIREVFAEYTDLIEPLSLDEAYLDVSHRDEPSDELALEIRRAIWRKTKLTSSAGIASNKLIAKIASDINKPCGQCVVADDEIDAFLAPLPVGKLWGVGSKGRERLSAMGIETCGDLRKLDKFTLAAELGRFGVELYDRCRGIDDREVSPDRVRKSSSQENTFRENITDLNSLRERMHLMLDDQVVELDKHHTDKILSGLVVKLKFDDFTTTTAERGSNSPDPDIYDQLLDEAWSRRDSPSVRLLGVGVKFVTESAEEDAPQLDLGI